MALVACLDCERPVSDVAPACPNCGRPPGFVGAAIGRSTDEEDALSPEAFTRFLRTVFGSTFQPGAFLERSEKDPKRYTSALKLIAANAFASGLYVTVSFWMRPVRAPSLRAKILAAAASMSLPWISVIGMRLAMRAFGARPTWKDATRVCGFIAGPSIVTSPLWLALIVLATNPFATLPPGAALSIVYGTYALRSLGMPRGRAIGAASVAFVLEVVLWTFVAAALGALLIALAQWVPDLR